MVALSHVSKTQPLSKFVFQKLSHLVSKRFTHRKYDNKMKLYNSGSQYKLKIKVIQYVDTKRLENKIREHLDERLYNYDLTRITIMSGKMCLSRLSK